MVFVPSNTKFNSEDKIKTYEQMQTLQNTIQIIILKKDRNSLSYPEFIL